MLKTRDNLHHNCVLEAVSQDWFSRRGTTGV